MKKPILALAFVLATSPARAETIPASALDKEYEACLGGSANAADEQRKQYCLCVRNKMAMWDIAVFARIAKEMAATGSTTASPELEALAKECVAAVLK